jgi:hypothetical protein
MDSSRSSNIVFRLPVFLTHFIVEKHRSDPTQIIGVVNQLSIALLSQKTSHQLVFTQK